MENEGKLIGRIKKFSASLLTNRFVHFLCACQGLDNRSRHRSVTDPTFPELGGGGERGEKEGVRENLAFEERATLEDFPVIYSKRN